ncbi:hypothetical protein ND861_18605 [Leptospira sp. 2 VSF19]|uniref:Uncharacterized protein n=1 Tax=Leptospira soteropolitanensis TaxID=2950025 RepID=A0AAW5VT87_9LEPT|nr:hypothetical protein [Leptospira soteropolitanensis]MCW7494671.1 hypothetical protein [Leptospira soteropolitanensis]MCW7502267.1 hypothetical protein [Leptospira soteropolitanensis]MCW7524495.1 hypothetical protein [Leptospira soteropolitanensis]MCW7528375.1 hypothetical protein [Leptospira soteropolitanensis]MCW7532225.1 hypothetical protein [Leptospira soteropolitanensis]
MNINEQLRDQIDLAFNEATLLGIEFKKEKSIVACTFDLITMNKNGEVPKDKRLLFIFKSVGRFVASLRNARWDDSTAKAEIFDYHNIGEVVQKFGARSIYGWEFINRGNEIYDTWKDRLSFDFNSNHTSGLTNTIDLFQENYNKHIDIRIWFDSFDILTPNYESVELEEFLENGKRGWEAIYSNNPRMQSFGIFPGSNDIE